MKLGEMKRDVIHQTQLKTISKLAEKSIRKLDKDKQISLWKFGGGF